jgi:dolichol-phosphate mannosyltransferase
MPEKDSSDENILVSIILPTFNEKNNIIPLIKRIRKAMQNENYNYEMLFVDDSNDNTPKVIQGFSQNYSYIKFIAGDNAGLSPAFIKGFNKSQGKHIVCMDTDLQHPPILIPKLIKELENGTELSVASRYIPGGSNEGLGKLWSFYGLYRRTVSLSMSYLTKILFIPIRKTTDPMTGYFAFQKSLIQNIEIEPRGFKILVEILMRAKPKKVTEIPLKFKPRENEESKATIGQGLEFFKHLSRLFIQLPEAARFEKFCLVGLSGVIINLGLLYTFVEFLNIQKTIAFTVSILISILTNYFFNSRFTYRDNRSRSRRESLKRLSYYYTFALLTMFITLSIYHELINNFHIYYMLAAFISIIFTTLLNFALVTKIIWKLPVEI